MTIRHTDRTGKAWTFKIHCTTVQGRMFERLLNAARNVGSREELSVSYLRDTEGNTAFQDDIEHVVLSALKTWTENRPAPEPPPPPPQPVIPRTAVSNLNLTTDADEVEEREPYYWENF